MTSDELRASIADVIIGSRPSQLAVRQAEMVQSALRAAWPEREFRLLPMETQGDRQIEEPLPEIGGKGLFTQELDSALAEGHLRMAVHSLKDLPVDTDSRLVVGAVLPRGEPRDVLITHGRIGDGELPQASRIGTSSLRRQAQILAWRPDLVVGPVRGNVGTRVDKVRRGDYDAIVLAGAGIQRLGFEASIGRVLPLDIMLPAPGQGAIAVQCCKGDGEILDLLKPLNHIPTLMATSAERALLAALGGGCSAPIGAYAEITEGQLEMQAVVASPDGQHILREVLTGTDPSPMGQALASRLIDRGAEEILRGT